MNIRFVSTLTAEEPGAHNFAPALLRAVGSLLDQVAHRLHRAKIETSGEQVFQLSSRPPLMAPTGAMRSISALTSW